MKTRRNFVKGLFGLAGGLIGINLVKADIPSPTKVKNKRRIQIEFFSCLCSNGNFLPFMFQHRGEQEIVPTILEVPFVIHWEGWNWKGNRKGCPMGCLEITIKECIDNFHVFKKINEAKLTNWIVHELENVPINKRNQEWVQRVSITTIKLWLNTT